MTIHLILLMNVFVNCHRNATQTVTTLKLYEDIRFNERKQQTKNNLYMRAENKHVAAIFFSLLS